MVCLACGLWGEKRRSAPGLCGTCRHSVRPAPALRSIGGIEVRAAWAHVGAARRLVHRLKYEAVWGVADLLAGAMLDLLPADATLLVPVPRTAWRRARYGVDHGVRLAAALGGLSGVPVGRRLTAPLWSPRHAGRHRLERQDPRFRLRGTAPEGVVVLVDDVLTTGSTMMAAARALGCRPIGVTATVALQVSPGGRA